MVVDCLGLSVPVEMPVMVREHLNNWYTLKAFYLAKSAVDLPFEVFNSVLYVTIVYFMTDQPLQVERFFIYLSTGLMNGLVSQSVGLTIGVAFDLMVLNRIRFQSTGRPFED